MRLACLMLLTALVGCAADPELAPGDTGDPESRHAQVDSVHTAPLSSLTITQALVQVDTSHPDLTAYRSWVEAAQADAEQAGLLPNPLLVVRMENSPWSSGSTRDEGEYVAGLSLQLPLSGRLSDAQAAGERQVEQREHELLARRRELHRQVRGAFATALSLERATAIQSQTVDLADEAVRLSRVRLRAGDAVPADLARVELEAYRARLELARVHSMRSQALVALAAAMGNPRQSILSLEGDLELAIDLPSLEDLDRRLERNPRLRAAQAEVALQEARVELARSRGIPDVSLDLFYRRLEETNQHAFDLGVGIPLPIFDRNQGGVRAALARQHASAARVRWTRNELVGALRAAQARLGRALMASQILREELLPRAETVLRSAEARFQAGDSSLVELLPIRRDWTSLQLEYIDALRGVMVAWSDLQALTSEPQRASR